MHQPRRTVLALIAALVAATLATAMKPPAPAQALTSKIWLNRAPNAQRLAGAALSADGEIGFVASSQHNFQYPPTEKARVWRSVNYGAQWTELTTFPLGSWESVAVSNDGQRVVALGTKPSSATKSVMISIDQGDSWTDHPLPESVVATVKEVAITPNGLYIALATTAGIYFSKYVNTSWSAWTTADSTKSLSSLALADGVTPTAFVVHAIDAGSSVYTERHDGAGTMSPSSWTPSTGGLLVDIATSDNGEVVLVSSTIGGSSATIHVSNDGGGLWANQPTTGQTNAFVSVAVSGNGSRCVIAGYGNPLLESNCASNTSFSAIPGVGLQPWLSFSLSATGSHLLAGTEVSSGPAVFVQMNTPAPSVTGLRYRSVISAEVIQAPASGGETLEIQGEYFHDISSISIGGVDVPTYSRDSDIAISLDLPPRNPGPADVVVTSAHGTGTLAGVLQYYALVAPTVTSSSLESGSFMGGTEVVFTGDGLAEVTSVRFGEREASIVYRYRNELVVSTPRNRVGLMSITLSNPTGTLVLPDAWTSAWESRSEDPQWSTIHGSGDNPFAYSGPRDGVSSILDDGDNGFYVFGNFDRLDGQRGTEYAAHWDGSAWNPIGEDGNGLSVFDRGGSPSTSLFGGQGILTATRDNAGSIWVGGEFEVDGRPANIARLSPPYVDWWVPSVVPDGRVTSITPVGDDVIVGGDFGPLTGVSTSSRLVRLSPDSNGTWTHSDVGVWSGIGSDGSGGSAIKNNGSLFGGTTKTVQDVLVGANNAVLAAGSFQLASTTSGHDLVAEFDGTSWRTLVPSAGLEVATSLARGVINGVDTIVVSICTQTSDGVEFERGRVVSIANGTATTVGVFNDCVRDIAVVGDSIVAAGWFGYLIENEVTTRRLRNLALLKDAEWTSLNARVPLDSLTTFDGYDLAVSSYQTDSEIGAIAGSRYMAQFGPIRELVGRTTPLAITNVSPVRTGDGVTVTVTGTGFTSETEVALENRPADNLVITSETSLRFTASWSDSNRELIVYGRTATRSATLSPPQPQRDTVTPSQQSPEQQTSTATQTPASTLPTSTSIRNFPSTKLLPTKTQLFPRASFSISAGGFTPGEEVWVLISSTPQRLRTATASVNGTVSTKITLPANLVGRHTLAIWSPSTGRGVRQPITISMTLKAKRATTASTLLKKHNIAIPKKSTLRLSSQTPKVCRATSSTRLTAVAKGTCRVSVKITPQKGKSSTKRLSILVP